MLTGIISFFDSGRCSKRPRGYVAEREISRGGGGAESIVLLGGERAGDHAVASVEKAGNIAAGGE
jgi:hypothetical protein